MLENNPIFNFVSNSYSKFLAPYCPNKLKSQNVEAYVEGEDSRPAFDLYLQLYMVKKKQASLYKMIFNGLAVVFFLLAAIVYFNTTNWACSLYFQNCAFIKASTYSLCLFLAFAAAGFAYSIHPEKETAQYLINRMLNALKDSYKRRKMELGFILDMQPETRKKRLFFKQNYQQTLEKMKEHKQQSFHTLEKLSYTSHYDRDTKNQLITQALSDLQNALNAALQSFKQKNYLLTMNQK